MPVTRSSSRPDSQQPSSQPYSSRRAGPSGSGGSRKTSSRTPSNEIIVLSSDDDEPPYKGTVSSVKKTAARPLRKKALASAVPPVLSGEVLEISSDDGSSCRGSSRRKQAKSSQPTNKDLERTIKKLHEEIEQYKQQLVQRSREVEDLKRDCSSKDVLSGFEEYTSCEVCTLTMWCPYTLPECGHSFCEGCLIDWFGTIHAQHVTANPQLDNNRVALAGQLQALAQMVPNLHAYGMHGQNHVRTVLAELRRLQPAYTCPSCRKEVLNKPVADFRLKALIKEIAGMMGETNSRKDASPHQGSGPFDHFFAAPIPVR